MRDLRRGLIVPAFITVTSFAPACSDDTPPSTETGSTEASSTTEASASTTAVPTSTGDTDTGDALPDCGMISDEPACKGTAGCLWDDLGGLCVTDCEMIDDAARCDMAAYCEWYDGKCYPPI